MKVALFLALLFPVHCFAESQKIFDGKSLEGWVVKGAACWTVKDGVLIGENDAKKKGSVLWTASKYQDFVLDFEFKYEGHIDSGVFVRNSKDQIQIGISGSLKRDMTASPYIAGKGYPAEAKGVKALLKEGQWNKMRVAVTGANYKVSLNGVEVLDFQSKTAVKEGPLGLQVHPGLMMKIEFRDIKLEVPK